MDCSNARQIEAKSKTRSEGERMKHIHVLFVLGLALAACQPTTPAGPPTVNVSSLADAGAGSLRETLSSAEAGSVVSLKGLDWHIDTGKQTRDQQKLDTRGHV
jgi:hypothetical protein